MPKAKTTSAEQVMNKTISIAGASMPADQPPPDTLPDTARVDRLAATGSEEEYQQELLRILRENHAASTEGVDIPCKPGLVGACARVLRAFLWKGLRYQHEQMAIRHNAIHARLAAALEYEHDLNQRRIAELEQRIAELQKPVSPEAPHE